NGVLVYLLLADRAVEIVADRGLNLQVDAAAWRMLAAGMAEAFRAGRFEEGLAAAVDRVDALLRRHYALADGERNPNELPDQPVVIA
ncbi:MAG: TPM domain-containing protein, partial [Rubrivivax sp.]|nr:TPM domain-containing protein [Rubrivivax sp.]